MATDYYHISSFSYPSFSSARFSINGDDCMRRYDDGRRSSLAVLAQRFFFLSFSPDSSPFFYISSADYTYIHATWSLVCFASITLVHYLEKVTKKNQREREKERNKADYNG